MTIDANLIEGFKIGVAVGLIMGLLLCAWLRIVCYRRGLTEGFAQGMKAGEASRSA